MTKKENKQRIKNEALNKIRNLHNPKIKKQYSGYCQENSSYYRDYMIDRILEKMEADLLKNFERNELINDIVSSGSVPSTSSTMQMYI